jgi:hypothetical protein
MAFVLRFVQRFRIADEKQFLELEKRFAELERQHPSLPKGRRMRPLSGRDPGHTLSWESEFDSLPALHQALDALAQSGEHSRLFEQQAPMMLESYTEIYELLDL